MRPERLLLALLALSAPLAAAPPAEAQKKDAREAEASIELLEFLGSWETATGAWNETMPDSEGTAPSPARSPKEKARD